MELNDLSFIIRKCIFEVHKNLGPGLLESIYEDALYIELEQCKLAVKRQVGIPVNYKGVNLGHGFRADLIVEGKVIIEIKSVEFLNRVHSKQVLTYLKLMNMKLGILVNFNESYISDQESIIRLMI
ncbi:MAG: GxxExxY protein [Bacteroidetes bacterium]|nr:GxxExxY protein [Bacteroidota bacterium]